MNSKFRKILNLISIILALLLTLGYFSFLSTIFKFYTADIRAASARENILTGEFIEGLSLAEEAIALNPREPYYYRLKAQSLLMSAHFTLDVPTEDLKKMALSTIKRSYELNLENFTTYRNTIPLYYYLGVKDLSSSEDEIELDQTYISIIQDYFGFLKAQYPTDVGTWVSLAYYEKRLGLMDDYEYTVEKIRTLRPDLLEWHPKLN